MPIGDLHPSSPTGEIVSDLTRGYNRKNDDFKVGVPVSVTVPLRASANSYGVDNPFDSDCVVEAILVVETLDATETIDVGVNSDTDGLFDGQSVAAVGVFKSTSSVLLTKSGRLTLDASSGTDTLAGKAVFQLTPLGE